MRVAPLAYIEGGLPIPEVPGWATVAGFLENEDFWGDVNFATSELRGAEGLDVAGFAVHRRTGVRGLAALQGDAYIVVPARTRRGVASDLTSAAADDGAGTVPSLLDVGPYADCSGWGSVGTTEQVVPLPEPPTTRLFIREARWTRAFARSTRGKIAAHC